MTLELDLPETTQSNAAQTTRRERRFPTRHRADCGRLGTGLLVGFLSLMPPAFG